METDLKTAEVIEFASGDAPLQGRLFLAPPKSSSESAIVMILTGDSPNGIKSKTWPPMINALLERGLSVFAFDFQGQGYSGGDRSALCLSVGCRNFIDAHQALHKRVGLRHRLLGLLGSSFGGAVLLSAHSAIPSYHAIALKSPGSFLAETYETEHGFPRGMEEWRREGISRVTGLSYEAYVDAIRHNTYLSSMSIQAPVLIVHGNADTIVPIEQSRRLFHLLSGRATLVELPNVNHHYREPGAQELLQREVCDFLAQRIGAKSNKENR